ncbi:type II secretion system protein [Candidatus Dependentiae bacterium]|nr:type II secretion system protein [Candidatus Dependentiae bacterium]MCC7415240.1 type II secretion system protein [Campylobacterota bacterium]
MAKSVAGFTLITVLVSISIVVCLLSLALANISFLDRLLVRTELNLLHATCCYAQQMAQINHEPCEIVCDLEKNSYRCDNHRRVLPQSVIFGVKQGVYGPPGNPHTRITKPITFQDSRMRASVEGTLNAGTVYLVDTGKRYQYALSSAITQVPYVRCYRYDTAFHIIK